MPRVKNAVYGDSTDTAYVQRYIRGDQEIKDIREKGYALPKEGGKQKKYWTAVNEPHVDYPEGTNLIRVPRGDVGANKAVSASNIEIHDRNTGKWSPIQGNSLGGSSGVGGSMDRKELQLGAELDPKAMMKREGYKKGGTVSSASKRADGIAQRGKTRGRFV